MILDILVPEDSFQSEREYIIKVLIEEFLGLSCNIIFSSEVNSCIQIKFDRKQININDAFFNLCRKHGWLSPATLPYNPLSTWCYPKTSKNQFSTNLPVIYGAPKVETSEGKISIGLDIFGSAFFMLSRYEEVIIEERDVHGRFPAKASVAYKGNFLHRPIVNEYLEMLWYYMKQLWSELKRKERTFATHVSCDVDHIWDRSVSQVPYLAKRLAGDILKRKSPSSFLQSLKTFVRVRTGEKEADPFNTFDFIMSCCEKEGLKAAFYFITDNAAGAIDGYYKIKSKQAKTLLKEINQRGHEIGLHLSYNSYLSSEQSKKEANLLKQTLSEFQIKKTPIGGRQHFLRWETPVTAQNWEKAGLSYDSTLAYAEMLGFRCGTCYQYPFYDVLERRQMNLIQRPLIVMDCTGLEYMKLSTKEALSHYIKLKDICRLYKGNFTFLWHNSYFKNEEYKTVFEEVIKH